MKTNLICNDGTVRPATILTTVLTAPEVLCWNGKFFKLKLLAPELYKKHGSEMDDPLIEYRECRGEYLSNLEVADSE